MTTVKLEINGTEIDLSRCPHSKDWMSCYLTGNEIDNRAVCAYCWLTAKLESYHPDAALGRLIRR